MLIWDPTKAASSHAALAGVLAGIVFAVLAILITRPQEGSFVSLREETEGPAEDNSPEQVLSRVLKLLVLAFFFLVVATVMWGGLAGHPSAADIAERASSNPGAQEKSAIRASAVGHFAIATPAVVTLALGALCLLAAIAEVLPLGAPTSRAELFEFSRNAFGWLGALSIFEVAYFATVALDLAIYPNLAAPDLIGLVFGVVTVAFATGLRRAVRKAQFKAPSGRYLLNVRLARDLSIRAAVLSAVVSTIGYVLTPSTTIASQLPTAQLATYSRWHIAATLLALAAGLLFAAFVVTAVWALQLSNISSGEPRIQQDQAPLASPPDMKAAAVAEVDAA